MGKKIAIGNDHGGYELKNQIVTFLKENGYEVLDFGCHSPESVDFPGYIKKFTDSIQNQTANKGIIICGTGIGVSIAANRNPGIRAALCTNEYMARKSREHNDANILALGARVVGTDLALSIIKAFLDTDFTSESRHVRRMNKMEELNK